MVWQPSAIDRASPPWWPASPLETWKDYLRLPRHRALGGRPARRLWRRELQLPRHGARRHAAAPRSLEAGGVGHQPRARGGGGPALRASATSRPQAKARAEEMVKNIPAAFSRRIDTLDWMTPATKARAKAKLGGAEGRRRLSRSLDRLFGPRGRARRRLRQPRSAPSCSSTGATCASSASPVDRGEWVMTPQTVNAVNLPVMNAMNFPAAHPAAAVLRPRAPGGHGLRRDRRHHRPRDHATASTTRARSSTPRAA